MDEQIDEIRSILCTSPSSSTAIRRLYDRLKLEHPRTSLAQICKKAHMPSKGYLSDIMAGRRTLNQSYQESLGAALGLSGLSLKYFRLMVERDHERLDSRRAALGEEMASIKKSFGIAFSSQPLSVLSNSRALEIYCAFGLFGNRPRLAQLIDFFGQAQADLTASALEALLRDGLISQEGETLALKENHVIMTGSDESHKSFLREAIRDVAAKVDRWAQDKVDAHFESAVISVNRHQYRQLLQRLKSDFLQWQSEMETHEADTIVRFNVQIYPVDAGS